MRLLLALLVRGAALTLLWWALTEGRSGYVGYGLVSIPVVLLASLWVAPAGAAAIGPRPSPRPAHLARRAVGLVTLVGWYAWQVVRGGVDVAQRLLRREVDITPVVVQLRTRLPEGAARQLAVGMYGLMPGSLVAHTDGDHLWLHVLDPDLGPTRQWRDLEDKLAHAADLDLAPLDTHPDADPHPT